MLEKIVTFLVLGMIVFAPGIHHWQQGDDPAGWYLIYLPWLLLIAAAFRDRWRRAPPR